MDTAIEGIYKDGMIKPLEEVKLENNTRVIIIIKEKRKKEMSLMDLAGVWRNRKDIDSRFREILKERENFDLKESK